MANVTKRSNKDGSTSYRVKVSAGVGADGRYIYRSATFTPPPKLTARQEAKAVQEFARDFEERVQNGLFVASNLTVDGLAEKWMNEYCIPQLKPHTVEGYQQLMPRVSAAIGHIKLANLRPGHIQEFYNQLAQPGIREDAKYRAKTAFIKAFPKGKRLPVQRASGVCAHTFTTVMQGRTVSKQTAEKVATAAGWAFSRAFTCCSTDTLSASSQHHYHLMLSSMFSTAVRWQLMDSNPCERVTPPKLDEVDVEFLDEEQIAALLEALPDAPDQLSVIVQLALFTGARRGEICGLRWADIDLDAGIMAINRNLSFIRHKGLVFDYPKTKKSRRCIRLSDDCIELLKDYRQWQLRERLKVGTYWQREVVIENGKKIKNDLLFTSPDGKPFDPNKVSSWFPKFLRAHGLPPCRFHSLRHSNAALLIAAHVPVTTVAGRLGHAQTSTTVNIYAAAIRSSDAAAADALGNVFERIKQRQEIG